MVYKFQGSLTYADVWILEAFDNGGAVSLHCGNIGVDDTGGQRVERHITYVIVSVEKESA
jgi:hypothetical protein